MGRIDSGFEQLWLDSRSHENPSFGSHDKPLLVCRGLLTTYEKPTMNSECEFIVATPAIFIDHGDALVPSSSIFIRGDEHK